MRPPPLALALLLALGGPAGLHADVARPAASAATAATPAAPAPAPGVDADLQALEARLLALDLAGRGQPLAAAQALDGLIAQAEQGAQTPQTPQTAPASALHLEALLVQGLLYARAARPALAERAAATLELLGRRLETRLGLAAASLVRAEIDNLGGQLAVAERKAATAASLLPGDAPPRMRMRFATVQGVIKDSAGKLPEAVRLLQEAVRLADALALPIARAQTRSLLAYSYFQGGEEQAALRLNREALAIAQDAGDALALARAWNTQSILMERLGSTEEEADAMLQAIEHAKRAGAPADEALFLANLADLHLKRGDYTTALSVARQALPLVREQKDLAGEVVALANMGLALIALKRLDEGKRQLEAAMAIDERRGSLIGVSQTLEEMGRYLERAGDPVGALRAYTRHRELRDDILQRDTQQALLSMQEAFDDERRTRELDLLERDNQLKTEQLRRRQLQQRLWLLAAAIGVLGSLLALLMLQRLRGVNRRLQRHNERLKAAGSLDPLTGLANRRALHDTLARVTRRDGLEGTLFLVDVDDFRRVNEERGHNVGDAVLVEVAHRLREALRGPDLIVRWGGEEFLVLMAAQGPGQAESLARRLLHSIGRAPLWVQGQAVPVTVSVGFASLPLEPQGLAIGSETALKLVDAAMLLAKAHGRNRAYGVRMVLAEDESGVREVAAGLEAAWREGRAALSLLRGPGEGVDSALAGLDTGPALLTPLPARGASGGARG